MAQWQPDDWRSIHEKRGELRVWANGATLTSATATGNTITFPVATTSGGTWYQALPSAIQVSPPVHYTASAYPTQEKSESSLEWLKRRVEEIRINLIPEPAMA